MCLQGVKYRHNFGPNFHPAFEVTIDLNAEVIPLTLLGADGQEVWQKKIGLEGKGILLWDMVDYLFQI